MHCDDLEKRSEKVKSKFLKILEYFGEDTTTTSDAFFLTLHKFVQAIIYSSSARFPSITIVWSIVAVAGVRADEGSRGETAQAGVEKASGRAECRSQKVTI